MLTSEASCRSEFFKGRHLPSSIDPLVSFIIFTGAAMFGLKPWARKGCIAYGIYEKYQTIPGDDRTTEIEKVLDEELERELGDAVVDADAAVDDDVEIDDGDVAAVQPAILVDDLAGRLVGQRESELGADSPFFRLWNRGRHRQGQYRAHGYQSISGHCESSFCHGRMSAVTATAFATAPPSHIHARC